MSNLNDQDELFTWDLPDPQRFIQRAYYLDARKGFPDDSALGRAMGVSTSQITRWSRGEGLNDADAWLLRDIASATARLADHYEESVIHKWLHGNNPDLEGVQPIEMLKQGRVAEVLMAIEAQTSGAFG